MGHYILVKGLVGEQLGLFVSYYASNKGQAYFFQKMLRTLSPLLQGTVICRGDSNIAFELSLDKSNPVNLVLHWPSKESFRVARLLLSLALVDAWREFYPTTRDYTYYLEPHSTYSRIDHAFISSVGISLLRKATIQESAWSDHSLVLVTLSVTFYA